MKTPTFLNLLLFLSTTLFAPALNAQEVPYTPFPTDNLIWSIWGDNIIHDTHFGVHYALGGDWWVFDDKTYTVVECSNSLSQVPMGIREENKKIYFIKLEDPDFGEHLLYDFNLDIGDTIFYDVAMCYYVKDNKIYFGFGTDEHYAVVREKGTTILKDGSVRNTMFIQGKSNSMWCIEGLGGTEIGLFEPLNVVRVTDGSIAQLICINKYANDSNSCLYSYEGGYFTPTPGFCPCMTQSVIENEGGKIRVTPNPTTGVLNLIQEPINNEQLTINNVEIFDIYGRKVISDMRLSDMRQSEIGKSEIKINIAHLPAGLYFVKITTENGVFM